MATMTFRRIATGVRTIDKTMTVTGSLAISVDGEAIAGSATTQFIVTLDVSACVGFSIVSSVAATLKTNDTGSPANTIVLVANQPYEFFTGSYNTFLLTTDVTSMYFVVAGATAGTVSIEALTDVTP